MRLRDRIVFVVAVTVALAACSGGGEATDTETASAPTSTAPPESPGTSAPSRSTAPQTTATSTVPTTTEPPLPPVRIEDTLVRLDDLVATHAAFGVLVPGAERNGPDSTRPDADVVCATSNSFVDGEVGDPSAHELVGCEFESVADAEAFAAEWATWYRDSEPEVGGLEVERAEPFIVGDWSGRSLVTAPDEAGQVWQITSFVRQYGRRVYRALVQRGAPPDRLADVDAEAAELAARQDALLADVLLDPDQPGAGLEAAADRLLLDGLFPPWETFASLAGAPITGHDRWHRLDAPDLPLNVVEDAGRSVTVDGAELSILASRFELPGDAAREARWIEVFCGDAPVTPVEGAVSAKRCTTDTESIAIVQHDDRTYRLNASAELPGYDRGAVVDELALALEERLAEFGLAGGPEPDTAVDPELFASGQMPFDLLPDLSADDIVNDYVLARPRLEHDPASGVISIEGSYERPGGSMFDGGQLSVRFHLGATDADLALRYPTASTPLDTTGEGWFGTDQVDTYDNAGQTGQSFRPLWARRWGDVVVVVRGDVGEPSSSRERIEPIVQLVLDRLVEHVDSIESWEVPPPGSPAFVAVQRTTNLMLSVPSPAVFLRRHVLANGRPVDGSPAGAVADWWLEYRDEDLVADAILEPGPVVGSQRIVQFESEAAAEAFHADVLRGTPELAEPVGWYETVGWLPRGDEGHGTFAMRSGRWVFVVDDVGFPPPREQFDEDGNELPPRSTRNHLDTWSVSIARSGLG